MSFASEACIGFLSRPAAGRWAAALLKATQQISGPWLQVSFNGGAHWQDLARPERYRHAGCDRCGNVDPEACRLHLHGPAGVVGAQGDIRPAFFCLHKDNHDLRNLRNQKEAVIPLHK